jgi:hypothetical protein
VVSDQYTENQVHITQTSAFQIIKPLSSWMVNELR